MQELIAALKHKARQTPPGQWVTGRGYDDTLLAERRHPTRHIRGQPPQRTFRTRDAESHRLR